MVRIIHVSRWYDRKVSEDSGIDNLHVFVCLEIAKVAKWALKSIIKMNHKIKKYLPN